MPLLASILLFFSPLLLAATVESSCSTCIDYTRTSETNGSTVVETVIRLIQHSGIFTDDYGALQRIAWLETQYGQNQLTYRPEHHGGIWNINQTGFNALDVSSQHLAMIQSEFCFNWAEVVWTDLRKPLYSALAARLLIHQSSNGIIPQDPSSQAQMWLDMYTSMDRTQDNYVDIAMQHNSTSNKVNISNINIDTPTVFSLCTNEFVYFSYNTSTDVPLIKVSLMSNGSASLYISNAGPPSESFYCAKIEETSSTGYVYVSVDQLSSCGSEEMLFISVVGREESRGMTAASLILSNANDSYEFIQNTGSDSDWFAIGMYSNHPDVGSIPISIFVTSDSDSAFNISIESYEGVILSGEVKPYETSEFFVPETYMVSNESDYMNGLIVRADTGNKMRVSVSNHYYISSDSYLALPLIQYQGVTEYTYFAVTPNFTSPNLTSRVLIVCGFNDTSITITSTQTAYMYLPSGVVTLQPSTSMEISGNIYQTILIESEEQLMGTKVVTDKPVTFLSGHQCASLPDNISCDFAIEQIPPTINWGRNFIFPLLSSRVGGSYLSILAAESDTTVEVSCTNSNGNSTLSDSFTISSSGDYATMLVAPDDALCSVISSKPTLLTVLSTSNNYDTTEGDPLMVLVQPVEQYVNVNHSFTAFKSDIDNHYLNLMVKASDSDNNIQLNDETISSSNWKSINTTGGVRAGYVTQLNVANTTHLVSLGSASSGRDVRVGGMIYGFACSVGYGQLIATNLYLIHETTNRLSANITMPPQQQRKIGDNVKLTCNTSGLPVYALHWRRGGSRIYPSCKHSISSNSPGSSVLTIYNASETDEGVYECVAHSYYSDPVTATSQTLSLDSPSTGHYSIPTVTPTPMSTWAYKDANQSLSFNITNAVPPVISSHLWWHFRPLEGEEKYLDPNATSKYIFSSDHLRIDVIGAQLSDSGNYTLIVRNEAGLVNSTITFNVYIAPNITNHSMPRDVTKNGSAYVTFNCTADGYPRPSITWTKDNVAVSSSNPRITISAMEINSTSERQQTKSSLTIRDLTEDDSGNYLCRASSLEVPREAVLDAPFHLNVRIINLTDHCANNPCKNGGTCFSKQSTFSCICDEGYAGNECQNMLIVYKAPEITEKPQGVVGEYFSPVNLTCKATGSPKPAILWYKDGVELNNTNDDSSVLKIPELRLDNRGYYHCVAKVIYNGEKIDTSEKVLINIRGIVQYEAIILAPVNDDSQSVEQKVRNSLHNDNFDGNTEVLLVKVKRQNSRRKRSTSRHDIIITLRTDMKPSDSLRKSIEDQINAASSSSGISSQQIDRFDGCKSDVTRIPPHTNRTDINVTIEWEESNLGEDVRVRCPCGGLNASSLIATRSCRGNFSDGGMWEEPYVKLCNFSDFAREICDLTERPVPERVEGLNNLTSDESFNLDSTDVAVVTLVLLTTTNDVKGDEKLTRSYLEVVDNIIAIEPVVLKESQNVSNTSSKILNTIDDILSELPVTSINEPVIITFDRLAASTIKVDAANFEGLVFASDVNSSNIGDPQYGSSDNVTTSGAVSITLPESLLDNVNTTGTIQVINKVFIDDILFLRRDNKSLDVNSAIVSAAIVDTPIRGLENSINISFPMGKGNISKQSCAFWNFSLDGGYGDWSSEGCTLVVVDANSVCLCDHLTNFALLLDVSEGENIPEGNRPIDHYLEAVTYIGIIISIVCILLTLFTYIVAKKLRKRSSGQLIINLCLALLFLYLSFILAVHSRKNEALCAISALILQYFFLVTFLAMGCESVILYRELVIIVGERKYGVALKAALVCWILPLLIVGFCFAPNYNHYIHKAFCRAFDIPFYIGTVAPFILIYIFNSVVFTIIIISLLKRGQSSATKLPGYMYVKQQLGVAISLSVLFGVTWGLGLFASNSIYKGNERHVRDAFAALFIILTTFHGLGLFVMHCVRPAKVREEVKAIFLDRNKTTTRTSGTGGIQKERMTAASKNAAYTAATIDKRNSYSMHPTDSIRDSTASLKKDGHDSFAIANSFATHEEETGFTANPNFVAVEDSPELTPVKKFQDKKFETKEDSNSSSGSYASNDNDPIVTVNGTPVEQ